MAAVMNAQEHMPKLGRSVDGFKGYCRISDGDGHDPETLGMFIPGMVADGWHGPWRSSAEAAAKDAAEHDARYHTTIEGDAS